MFTAFIAATWLGGQVQTSLAQTVSPNEAAKVSPRKESAPRKEAATSDPHTTGFVTGAAQSTEFAIAQDIATTLASGQETGPHGEVALRVLPMVGNGGIRNIIDILSLAGADMAIAPVLLADRLRSTGTLGDIGNKLVYITPLFVEEFHLLARSEIKSLSDLAGKRVNLGEEGSAGAVLGREVLNHLQVKVSESNLTLDSALDGMRKGQISGALLVSGKPVGFLARYAQGDGLHFLSIPYSREMLQHDYLPSTLRHEDYPDIIGDSDSVDTIAIKCALFAYNWPIRSERFPLLELFVQTLFSRFPEFLGDGHHPKWREVNLAALLPGWRRFRPAERWLQQQSGGEAALRKAFGRFLEQKSISNPPDREQLFQDFMRWRERQQGR
ncbi:TAXI family TRAP transporter solute-binding subunit [Bradyrhizobium centrolobii]|uniref:TAXI family TRAP transporter solute-binding subunit n=1 Tax=Bradyrhizobium centrolobii TaxID=1505087 RepID=UPI001FDA9954|nr:TAXI family TRAP transporter solute-binding subunit [Bradyrhizobium centrolobii]